MVYKRAAIFEVAPPLAPIDRVARRVSREGEHWEPMRTRHPDQSPFTWAAPPESKPRPEWMPDYAGTRRGRMTAFRYHEKSKHGDRKWLVRCDCGNFEARRIIKWLAHENALDSCDRCDEAHRVKTGQYLAGKTGDKFTAKGQSQ